MPLTLTPATPDVSGITQDHLHAIARVCREKNVFLIVRPSEKETMTLIKAGFATKNMDIHDKSSNWGLTAGMVPKDPRFSKKRSGIPITDASLLAGHHGLAHSIHLKFKQPWLALIGTHFDCTVRPQCGCGFKQTQGWMHFRSAKDSTFCFLMKESDLSVYWRYAEPGSNAVINAKFGGDINAVPVFVWAYQVGAEPIPVTGDYDVWMLAHHIGTPGAEIIHSNADPSGRSAASDFYTGFLGSLNTACFRGQGGGNVFNHGAEAQNYSFTQTLDKPNTVFCPGQQEPFMVPNELLPRIVFDMLSHGYVATLNPKWRKGITLGVEDTGYAMEQSMTHDPALELAIWRQQNMHSIAPQSTVTSAAHAVRVQGAVARASGSGNEFADDALTQVETSAALTIQRGFREARGRSAMKSRAGTAQRTASEQLAHDRYAQILDARVLAASLKKRVADPSGGMTANQAIGLLTEQLQGNRGLALAIFNGFSFRDRVKQFEIFRKIAIATGREYVPRDDPFPETCFKPEAGGDPGLARLQAMTQERLFGRTGFLVDHGHATPIDRMQEGRE